MMGPQTYVLPRWAYDQLDLWFVERCSHEGRDVCSVCREQEKRS